MDKQNNYNELSGYWAMTRNERAQHDDRLLDPQRLQRMSLERRKNYLEMLHVHTLMGSDITQRMLRNPAYTAYKEHLQDVLDDLSHRQERLLQLIEKSET